MPNERTSMKRIDAITRHFKLEDVKQVLKELAITALTVDEVHGFGRQSGHQNHYRGAEYIIDFAPKVMIMVYASDELTPVVVETIVETARASEMGDGKIAVYNIEDLIRIRTGESKDTARCCVSRQAARSAEINGFRSTVLMIQAPVVPFTRCLQDSTVACLPVE